MRSPSAPLALLLILTALAPTLRAGSSPLSTKGMGLPISPADSRERSMGGSGLASTPGFGPSLRNPSRTAFNTKTSFTAMMESELNWLQDEQTSNRLVSTQVPLVAMNFQIGRYGNLGLHYFQLFERNFSYTSPGASGVENASWNYEGGTSEYGMNFAYAFNPRFALAAGLNYLQGRNRDIERTTFSNDGSQPELNNSLPVEDTLSVRRKAIYPTVSATYRTRPVQFGIGLSFPAETEERIDRGIGSMESDLKTEDNVTDMRELPFKASAGMSVRLGAGKFLNLDASGEQWLESEMNDAFGLGLGIEQVGMGRDFDSYRSRMSYRAGLAWQRLPIDEADQYTLALGTGLPLGNRGNKMDLALEYVHRGSKENLGFVEDLVRLTVSLTGVGSWGESSRPRR